MHSCLSELNSCFFFLIPRIVSKPQQIVSAVREIVTKKFLSHYAPL